MENKELVLSKLEDLEKLFNEKFEVNNQAHERTLEQVVKINGRVGSLENLKNKVVGALFLANIIGVPLLIIFISSYFT